MIKKLLITLLLCLLPISAFAQDYWVYIRTYDRISPNVEDTAGRSKKGDIIAILPDTPQFIPTETEKKEYAIIKVSNIDKIDIDNYLQGWQEQDGILPDGNPKYISKAYRKNKLKIDNLGIVKEGVFPFSISVMSLKNNVSEKTVLDIAHYKQESENYAKYFPIKKKIYSIIDLIMPKAYAVTVSTINKTGETYNTLTLWEDAKDGVLTDIQEADCYDDDGTLFDSVTIDGSTTTALFYMYITCPVGERHNGTISSGFLLDCGTSNTATLTIADQYTIVEWIKLTNTQNYVTGGFVILGGGENSTVRYCIIYNVRCDGNYTGALSISYPGNGAVLIYRNIIYGAVKDADNNASAGDGIQGGGTGATSSPKIYANTIYNCVGNLIESNGGGGGGGLPDVQNCALFTAGASCFSGSFSVENYNCISDTTGTGANDIESKTATNQFVNIGAGTENLHLKVGADCIDVGSALGSPYDYDIDYVQVSGTYDIGADEYVASGARQRIIMVQ